MPVDKTLQVTERHGFYMLTVFMEHKILSGIFLSLLLLSIICQIMIGVLYQKMIKETENMSATKNKLLKQCKLKFANCYQLNKGVANIPVFVDKFISKVSIMRISLRSMQHLSGQLMLLTVVVAGVGACREIIQGETVGKVLPYYIVSFLGLYIYFSISGLVDLQGKKERLKTNLVDYLENHMINKLKQSAFDWTEITGENTLPIDNKSQKKNEDIDEEAAKEKIRAMREEIGLSAERGETEKSNDAIKYEEKIIPDESEKEAKKAVFSKQEEQELEELLREFFV